MNATYLKPACLRVLRFSGSSPSSSFRSLGYASLLSVLQKDLLQKHDHLLVVFELKLARQFSLLFTQFVLYLEAILHPHAQLLLRT